MTARSLGMKWMWVIMAVIMTSWAISYSLQWKNINNFHLSSVYNIKIPLKIIKSFLPQEFHCLLLFQLEGPWEQPFWKRDYKYLNIQSFESLFDIIRSISSIGIGLWWLHLLYIKCCRDLVICGELNVCLVAMATFDLWFQTSYLLHIFHDVGWYKFTSMNPSWEKFMNFII